MKNIVINTAPGRAVVTGVCPRLLEEIRSIIPTIRNNNVYRFYARFEFTTLWGIRAKPHKLRQIFQGIAPFQSVAELPDMAQFHANLKEALPDSEKRSDGFHPDGHVSVAPRVTLTIYKPSWSGREVLLSDGFCPVRMEEHGNYIKGISAAEFLSTLFPDT